MVYGLIANTQSNNNSECASARKKKKRKHKENWELYDCFCISLLCSGFMVWMYAI